MLDNDDERNVRMDIMDANEQIRFSPSLDWV